MELNNHTAGSGPRLVLVHGTGGRWENWAPVIDALAAEAEVVALDLPGFGHSPPLEGPPTVAALAAAVADFAGPEPFHVAGNSLGGAIALELGRMGAAGSVCAISPIGFWTARERAFCRTSLQVSRSLAERIEPFAEKLIKSPVGGALMSQLVARPGRIPPAEAAHAVRGMARCASFDGVLEHAFYERDAGTAPPCPATIAWGTQDRLLLPRQAERARRLLPTATHVWLQGCGHLPTWDDPERVAEVLLAATRRSRPQPARAAG